DSRRLLQTIAMSSEELEAISYIRTPSAIRERSGDVLDAGLRGELAHFAIELTRLPLVIDRVLRVTQARYPSLDIPMHSRWNHFDAGGVQRVLELNGKLRDLGIHEQACSAFDLTVLSVILDAGAGSEWRYQERETGLAFSHSEGLAVA